MIGHAPSPIQGGPSTTVADLEAVLSAWFDAEVILTSSGRAAILLWLTASGLNRYKHRITTPRMISACVIEAVVQRGFPIDCESYRYQTDALLFYHQYGFPQKVRPKPGIVIEDICHSFFAGETTGAREFAGQAAVFSLPKFLNCPTMSGGIATPDCELADRLRSLRDSADAPDAAERHRHGEVFRAGGVSMSSIYVARLFSPRILDEELEGLPTSIADIAEIGATRRRIAEVYLGMFGATRRPDDWDSMILASLPFVFPVFGEPDELAVANERLAEGGISAGVYSIDVERQMFDPDHRRALLLPCHHEVSDTHIEIIKDSCRSLM